MNPLLPIMIAQQPLAPDERLETGTVHEALRKGFFSLANHLGLSSDEAELISFTMDVNESAYGIEDEDLFELEVNHKIGTPNAKICHMRCYADATGRAHWHALFAEFNQKGELANIILTDSRLKGKKGITAAQDMDSNPFLIAQKAQVNFVPGPQQPYGIHNCWVYCLANLASLAAQGKTYEPQTSNLGQEIAKHIMDQDRIPCLLSEKTALVQSANDLHTSQSAETVLVSKPTASENIHRLFAVNEAASMGKKQSPPYENEAILNNPEPTGQEENRQMDVGLISLFLGADAMVLGMLLLAAAPPLSIGVGLSVFLVGLILSVSGVAILTSGSPMKNPELVESPEHLITARV
ncbi:hypothetical protein [Legionella jordanis]|uniref:Uncharacterized protein n=1 Tax=Legionella jordanis TaxID=456 RepID=A0A0W0VC09_9GAMM|nr:hypothetical protein [Legionella jordanis]KTD17421.1 hypothetical protein Ljor_1727 [Legionella jordanis]RMX01815.1 hypothetical protein EAW55_09920 [Legionella jordanis]RMX15479.1 hypothetical protein EAS68_12380 [Legionella jordanis]VEH11557.1 Uncharacterised protein [Legionella jordanis]